jgi:hypothetical protein
VVRQLRGRKNKQINKANINKVNGILKWLAWKKNMQSLNSAH